MAILAAINDDAGDKERVAKLKKVSEKRYGTESRPALSLDREQAILAFGDHPPPAFAEHRVAFQVLAAAGGTHTLHIFFGHEEPGLV